VLSFATFYYLCQTISVTPPHFAGASVLNAGMERMRMLSSLTGGSDLIDMSMAASTATPRAMITMTRPTGEAVGVPAFFPVEPGMTIADLIEREGDREFLDPLTNRRTSLRDLYALGEADPGTVLDSAASALASLEGRVLDLPGLVLGRTVLEETIESRGIDRLNADLIGAPARAATMPATVLKGVEPRSPLAIRLKNLTIAGVAEQPREEFVETVLKGASARNRKELEAQAVRTWEAATRVAELGRKPTP
jgi:hypothetical protein